MTPEEIKDKLRDGITAMIKAEPADLEQAGEMFRSALRAKAQQIVNPEVEQELETPASETTNDVVDPAKTK